MDKENNVNVQNITSVSPVSSFASPNKTFIPIQNQECNKNQLDKVNTANVSECN